MSLEGRAVLFGSQLSGLWSAAVHLQLKGGQVPQLVEGGGGHLTLTPLHISVTKNLLGSICG